MTTHVPAPPRDFDGARVTVMGLGRFGGGVGVTRWLAAQGARVLVTDTAPAAKLERSLGEIADLVEAGAVTLRLGEHREEDFAGGAADVVVANPAVPRPWENRFLNAATASGVPITTEIRLLVERLPNWERTIGVTGTAGKSTVVSMVAHLIRGSVQDDDRRSVRAHLGGNIGGSLLDQLADIRERDWAVLELSSAQLYWLGHGVGYDEAGGIAPRIAVVTNLLPNHLDWHGSFEHYEESKKNICRHQIGGYYNPFLFVHDPRNPRIAQWDRLDGHAKGIWMSDADRLREEYDVALPGRHNAVNALLAVRTCETVQEIEHSGEVLDPDRFDGALERAMASFRGLPHRLERVGEFEGVRAFNDSKCTTPEAAALAVGAFEEEGECGSEAVHLICGGYDKGVDLSPMVDAAARCGGVYTIGATGPAIGAAVRAMGGRVVECGELESAVARAVEGVRGDGGGGVVLLSPGCASWDQFENYEARGEAFGAAIQRMLSGDAG